MTHTSTTALNQLTRKPAPPSNSRPIEHQHPRHGRQQCSHPTQETARALERHPPKHLHRDQREKRPHDIATETLRRDRRARVHTIGISEVVKHRQVDREDADGRAANCTHRRDPVHAAELGPAEPEEADGQEDGFDAGEVEAALGGGGQFAGRVAQGELFLVDGDDGGDEGASDDGSVDGADGGGGGEGVGVVGAEDEGDGGELEVEDSGERD